MKIHWLSSNQSTSGVNYYRNYKRQCKVFHDDHDNELKENHVLMVPMDHGEYEFRERDDSMIFCT